MQVLKRETLILKDGRVLAVELRQHSAEDQARNYEQPYSVVLTGSPFTDHKGFPTLARATSAYEKTIRKFQSL